MLCRFTRWICVSTREAWRPEASEKLSSMSLTNQDSLRLSALHIEQSKMTSLRLTTSSERTSRARTIRSSFKKEDRVLDHERYTNQWQIDLPQGVLAKPINGYPPSQIVAIAATSLFTFLGQWIFISNTFFRFTMPSSFISTRLIF